MIKRTITALMLSLGIPASGNTDSPAVPDDTPLTQNQLNEIELLSVAENFNGRQSLDEITALLQSGLNINAQDTEGNTPLLLLCRALELDYRYNRDQHYAQAVDAAIILLLQHGADTQIACDDGTTPLVCAVRHKKSMIVDIILNNTDGVPKDFSKALRFSGDRSKEREMLMDHVERIIQNNPQERERIMFEIRKDRY